MKFILTDYISYLHISYYSNILKGKYNTLKDNILIRPSMESQKAFNKFQTHTCLYLCKYLVMEKCWRTF